MEVSDLTPRPQAVRTSDGVVHRAATIYIPGVRDGLGTDWRTMMACTGVIPDEGTASVLYEEAAVTCVMCASDRPLVGDVYRLSLKEFALGAIYGRKRLPIPPQVAAWQAALPNYSELEAQIVAAMHGATSLQPKKTFRRRLMERLLGR